MKIDIITTKDKFSTKNPYFHKVILIHEDGSKETLYTGSDMLKATDIKMKAQSYINDQLNK